MPVRPPSSARQAFDAKRRAEPATRRLYGTARWQAVRAQQLRDVPLCEMCADEDRVTPATVCDHRVPHRGDVAKFWSGPFQSLCAFHHNSAKQREEQVTLHQRGVWH